MYVNTFGFSQLSDNPPDYNNSHYKWKFTDKIVYVKSTHLLLLMNILPQFKQPIIVVCGGDDYTFPDDFLNCKEFPLFSHENLKKLYIQNYSPNYERCNKNIKWHPLPIGLDYHSLYFSTTEHSWGKSGSTPQEQENILLSCISKMTPIDKCRYEIITNFQHAICNPEKRRIRRQYIYDIIKDVDWMVWLPPSNREDFWMMCKDYAFVLCPEGNGFDTHRAWEVLSLGKIPVISKLDINIVYDDLPVWIIDDWNDFGKLTIKDLENTHKLFMDNWDKYDFFKLRMKWWKDKINEVDNF